MMNTYKGVAAIGVNQEGFGYKYYNLNYAGNVFIYKFEIIMVEVEGILSFIFIGIETRLVSMNSAF